MDGSATATRPRPRFARELQVPELHLPAGALMGAVLAVATNAKGDIFVFHQPNAQGTDDNAAKQNWLPPLIHFTKDGKYITSWGGADHIPKVDGVSQWPVGHEGLECDAEGNLWIFGYKDGDNAVLKFSPDGKLLLRIGQRGKTGNDDDTEFMDRPTTCYHDVKNREVFVSDGYGNHRVIAFNSDTGKFTRMWGAFGRKPSTMTPEGDGYAPFAVHRVTCGPNGRIYVADRAKSRIQEFELIPGGAKFLREVIVAPGTSVRGTGSTWDIGFSPDGKFMYVADGPNFRVWTVAVDTLEVLGSTSVHEEYENDVNLPIHYTLLHRFWIEPNGDILLALVNRGLKRLKFLGVR
jgi:DNA-binding beta-propeller fold protein YncE